MKSLLLFILMLVANAHGQSLPPTITLAWTELTPGVTFIVWQSVDLTNWTPVAITTNSFTTFDDAAPVSYFAVCSCDLSVIDNKVFSALSTPLQVSISKP
jgi:hypothetical protein